MNDMESAQVKATSTEPLGLYIHVPFCASTCDFCAFYQMKPTADDVDKFLQGVRTEAAMINWPRKLSTVFWGGGTPGLLSPNTIRQIGELVHEQGLDSNYEWSVEMAPASVTEARLAALKEIGVTRISMGVQSFQPELLDALGRQHSLAQVYRAYDRVQTAEFQSVNLDLMFALPGQTAAEWSADVAEAVRLAPDHLSTYCLTFEEDTALWVKLSEGRVKLDPEHEARLYESTWAQLEAAGYAQYEVANFSRPDHQCRHNLNTWRMHEWVGLGPSAASQHDGWRGGNLADLAHWHEQIARGVRMNEDRLELTPTQLAEDAFIFGLRMNAGVDVPHWKQRAPEASWDEVDQRLVQLIAGGLAEQNGANVRLTGKGRLLADSVGLEMMEAFEDTLSIT